MSLDGIVKVFLGTKVLSGFATRGLCADVIRLVLAEHEFVTADIVLEELTCALRQKIHLPEHFIDEILAFGKLHHPIQTELGMR
jgi:hypothetical protein